MSENLDSVSILVEFLFLNGEVWRIELRLGAHCERFSKNGLVDTMCRNRVFQKGFSSLVNFRREVLTYEAL